MRRRWLWQIYPLLLSLGGITVLGLIWHSLGVIQQKNEAHVRASLQAQAELLAQSLSFVLTSPPSLDLQTFCQQLSQRLKIQVTVYRPSGEVWGDSASSNSAAPLSSEVNEALHGQSASRQHSSPTGLYQIFYIALPIWDEHQRMLGVIRLGIPQAAEKTGLAWSFGAILVLVFGIIASSLWNYRHLRHPLNAMTQNAEALARGELHHRLIIPESTAVGGLAQAMNQMAAQLDERLRTVLQQRNEQEAVLSSMVEGVLAVDLQERLINLNHSAAQLFGIDVGQVRGRNLHEVVRNADLYKFVADTLERQAPLEGEITIREQTTKVLQAHGTLLRDSRGETIGALVVLNDITRLRQLETIRRDFVANVSHELKTPITSIKGFVETLLDGAIQRPEEAHHFLEIIAKHADRLGAIIDDLLSLSRIEQEVEKNGIVLEPVALYSVLESAIQACELNAQAKAISIQLNCPAEVFACLKPPLFEQALINLIDNAIKYSPPEKAIQVEVLEQDQGVIIRVCDQGSGISAEHLPRIFERFYRVDKSRSQKIQGTGLGLAIVKHIVQAHHGTLTVESQVNQGSTFAIHLPCPPDCLLKS